MAEPEIQTFDEEQYYPSPFSKAYSFDDVTLPNRYSDVTPAHVDLRTRITQDIEAALPICSAAMDTVTEREQAKALSQLGGFPFIHGNFPTIEQQIAEVEAVKRSEGDVILTPEVASPEMSIGNLLDKLKARGVTGSPVTIDGEPHTKLVGMITSRDLRDADVLGTVADYMTSENLITAPEGTSLEQAREIFAQSRKEKLPIVDEEGNLRGLLTYKDIQKQRSYPNATKDKFGQLMVGAAVRVTGDFMDEARALARAGADVLCPDVSHGHSRNVLVAITKLKEEFNGQPQIAGGNVVTYAGGLAIMHAGADAVKVGISIGATCTTGNVAGSGLPQLTAVLEVSRIKDHPDAPPIIADGGIKHSGDIVKALAAGADSVMIGTRFASTNEAPNKEVIIDGKHYRTVRGMGSKGAMKVGKIASGRYQLDGKDPKKHTAEGEEGLVSSAGPLADVVEELVGGVQSGLGSQGAHNIGQLHGRKIFATVTSSGIQERNPHDIILTKDLSIGS